MQKTLLQPSGINNHFYGQGLAFNDYIELMRNIIVEARPDLTLENSKLIVEANSPFIRLPKTSSPQNGILLIHGLFDSPFFLQDIADYFVTKDFLVYAVLLPGHGTVPADLLSIKYQEWIKCIDYGMNTLAAQVKNIYVAGYSLGATLALHHTLQQQLCKAIFMLAPAFKPKSTLRYFLARYHKLFSWIADKLKWYQIKENNNFAKYNCYTFNAGYQACLLMTKLRSLMKEKNLEIPVFMSLTSDDETVSDNAALSFFLHHQHPHSQLILYSNDTITYPDPRINLRPSAYPGEKILNFSHICLPISPENNYFGKNSSYRDFSHYQNCDLQNDENIYLGAITPQNLKRYTIQRLSYNPDFAYFLQSMDNFLKKF
jgi:esterase/lipase